MEVRARFLAASFHGLMEWWLNEGCPTSKEEMARWFWQMVQPVWFGSAPVGPDMPAPPATTTRDGRVSA
jgi:hypothetical protein